MFYHQERQVRIVVHGDDFTVLGYKNQISWLHTELLKKYEIVIRGQIGPGPNDNKVATILNRLIEWTPEGIWYEPDARHVDILINNLSISPSTKHTTMEPNKHDKEPVPLDGTAGTCYRADVARMNYLSQDRCHVTFPVKDLSRDMSSPLIFRRTT